jgi:hypothetical protein
MVYVPTLRVRAGDAEVQLVLRQVEDDLIVVLAYSSLPALVAGCGPHQPWATLRSEVLDALLPELGATAVLLDVPLPEADWVSA